MGTDESNLDPAQVEDQDSEATMTAPPSERPLGDWAEDLDDDEIEPHSSGLAEDADVAEADQGEPLN